jgi:hypothetical protein
MLKSPEKRLELWHKCVKTQDTNLILQMLHPQVIFKTPLYLKPRIGADLVSAILASASNIFENFTYHREWISKDGLDFALEFSATVEGKDIRGLDLIKFDQDGKIIEFEVMLRPVKTTIRFGELQAKGIPIMIEKLGSKAKF